MGVSGHCLSHDVGATELQLSALIKLHSDEILNAAVQLVPRLTQLPQVNRECRTSHPVKDPL